MAILENPVEISHIALIFLIELIVTSFHLSYAGWLYVFLWAQSVALKGGFHGLAYVSKSILSLASNQWYDLKNRIEM